uniref:protein-serine/threonine phosphatase n=1 Tax=Zea mays TaxID=4577 RepID=C0PAG6_MAIZE|nr:unknown [Zea mays]
MPRGLSREEWLHMLPRALVAGFVKTDKEFQSKGQTSGTTATFVIIDGWTITVASVGDSRCILDAQGGAVSLLTVDHRLEENVEERERVTASGGEVGRLSVVGGAEIGPLRCWPGGLCLSRSIGDIDVGEFIVPVPYVKLKSFIFRKKAKDPSQKLTKQHSAVGIVEEIFEEGSAMLSERLGPDLDGRRTSSLFTCAICQLDLEPSEGISVHAGSIFSSTSRPWEGPFLCSDCREKKDAMEGKRPSGVKVL